MGLDLESSSSIYNTYAMLLFYILFVYCTYNIVYYVISHKNNDVSYSTPNDSTITNKHPVSEVLNARSLRDAGISMIPQTPTATRQDFLTDMDIRINPKVKQIRDEMVRLDHIEQIHTKLEELQDRGVFLSDYTRINNYMKSVYDDIDAYFYKMYKSITLVVYDIMYPWIYKFTM